MSDDWPQIKARLERLTAADGCWPAGGFEASGGILADIRAALKHGDKCVEELEKQRSREEVTSDIRAALQRVEFWETANKRMSEQELEAECKSCAALRQRESEQAERIVGLEFKLNHECAELLKQQCENAALRQRVEELERELAVAQERLNPRFGQ